MCVLDKSSCIPNLGRMSQSHSIPSNLELALDGLAGRDMPCLPTTRPAVPAAAAAASSGSDPDCVDGGGDAGRESPMLLAGVDCRDVGGDGTTAVASRLYDDRAVRRLLDNVLRLC